MTPGLPPLPIAELGEPVLTPMAVPLTTARIVIVTSAGVRIDGEPPFAPVNDLTYRRLDGDADTSRLKPSHPTPVRRPAESDINVVFPLDRLRELAAAGQVGVPAAIHLSFLGTIKRLVALVTDLAPALAREAVDAGADAALLVPL